MEIPTIDQLAKLDAEQLDAWSDVGLALRIALVEQPERFAAAVEKFTGDDSGVAIEAFVDAVEDERDHRGDSHAALIAAHVTDQAEAADEHGSAGPSNLRRHASLLLRLSQVTSAKEILQNQVRLLCRDVGLRVAP
jgi:hypothetical protein